MNVLPGALAALRSPAVVALLLFAPPAPALDDAAEPTRGGAASDAGAPDAGSTVPGGLFTISGKIGAVDPARGRFTIEGPDGAVELGVDRNTAVYLERRMGTLRSLTAGLPVRACYAGADKVAFWVEVHAKGVTPGRAGLEVKPPAAGPATPVTGDEDEGAVPPDSGSAPASATPPAHPGPGGLAPGTKSGG